MGIITVKNNRLYWLGRYTERVYQGVVNLRTIQDNLLDDIHIDIADYRRKLGITSTTFSSAEDFCERFAFDRSMPESILCSADAMLGNGMVLREILGSQTLSYLQMTMTALEAAVTSNSNEMQLQWALDDIMAFRGSYAEFIDEEEVRNTIRSGASIERLSIYLRLEVERTLLVKEFKKLVNRLHKTNLEYDEDKLAVILEFISIKEEYPNYFELIDCVETLFRI